MSDNNERANSILDTNSDELRQQHEETSRAERVREWADRKASKNKKSGLNFWFIVIASVVLAAIILLKGITTINQQLAFELAVGEVDIIGVSDGVYSGTYDSGQLAATVDVAIQSGGIHAIRLSSFTGIDKERANEVFEKIVAAQKINVKDGDVGTQYTDKVIQCAVYNALASAAAQRDEALAEALLSGSDAPVVQESAAL